MGTAKALRRLQEDLGELLESHAGGDTEQFSDYARDPVAFIQDVLRGDPWEAQERIAESVSAAPLVAVRSCNAAGKDWIAAQLALWWVYARRGLVLLTGPTQRQVREIVMGEVGRAFGRARDLPGELYASALRVPGADRAGIVAFVSNDASKMTGFHHEQLLVVLTEAQGVESWAWEAAYACATAAENRILAVGNPLSPSGPFYSACGSPNWKVHAISAFDCPNVREGQEVIPGAITLEGVGRIEQEYGKGSGVYRARVLGEFPDESVYGLIRRSWLEAAAERWERGELADPSAFPIAACDPARYGPDLTSLAVRRGPVLESLETWGKLDTFESARRVEGAVRVAGVIPELEIRPGRSLSARGHVIVDEVGVGAGVLDQLRRTGLRCHPYNGGRGARDPRKYLNRRAEDWWRLRELLEDGQIALPPDDRLADELTGISWSVTADGRIQLESKEELRSRLGRSPDRADAVVMTFSQTHKGSFQRIRVRL